MRRVTFALAVFVLAGCAHQVADRGPALIARHEPELVRFDGALANRTLKALAPSETLARLRIGTRELQNAGHGPVNLALVVDTSGSMEGAAIRDARAASLALLDALSPGDQLAVVSFDSQARVLVPSTTISPRSLPAMRAQIETMQAVGTTDLAAGLRLGYTEVQRNFQQNGVNRIVLMSDGVPNDPAPVLPLADAAGRQGISITSLGLGQDYDETLMGAIAMHSGGRFHFVKEPAAVAAVFKDEVLRLHRVVAHNMILNLSPGPGVKVLGVVGQAGPDPRVVALGDLAEGETRDVIVRLSANGRREGAVIEIIDGLLGFEDAVNGAGHCERRVFLAAHATTSQAELDAGRDLEILRAAAAAETAGQVLQAIALARAGRPDQARVILDDAEKAADAAIATLGGDDLIAQARKIAPLRAALPEFAAEQARLVLPAAKLPTAPVQATVDLAATPASEPPANVVHSAHDDALETIQGRSWRHR